MHIYYCWVTALLPSYQDAIIAGLVRKGYMVGPASKDGKLISPPNDNAPAVLFALSVYKAQEITVNQIYDDLIAVLKETKSYYYSVIVSLASEATWASGNFVIPAKNKPTPPPVPGSKKNVN